MSFFPVVGGTSYMSRPPQRPQTTGRPNNEPRQLEYNGAMSDFKHMFPTLDREVIEAVLRANNGLVDATIDQLLSMGVDMEGGNVPSEESEYPVLPSYSTLQKNEPPPAYTPKDPGSSSSRPLPARPYSAWNPPLLGKLPDDFLRLGPAGRSSPSVTGDAIADRELEQFVEDEKLARILQNEEFMRELRRNKDFMLSLEKETQNRSYPVASTATAAVGGDCPSSSTSPLQVGRATEQVTGAVGGHPSSSPDDAVLREKLKHMGKSTRKKFEKVVKMFHRKDVNRANIIATGSAASTANLLEDGSDDDDVIAAGSAASTANLLEDYSDDDDLLNVMGSARLEIMEEREEDKEEEKRFPKIATPAKPPQGDQKKGATDEPIVFFAEDNEFEYKKEH